MFWEIRKENSLSDLALKAWGEYRRPVASARRNASSTEGLCRCSRPKPPATPPRTQAYRFSFSPPLATTSHSALHTISGQMQEASSLDLFPLSIFSLSPHLAPQWVCGTCSKSVHPHQLVKRWTMSTKTEKSRVLDASAIASKYESPSGMKNTTFCDGGRNHLFHSLQFHTKGCVHFLQFHA